MHNDNFVRSISIIIYARIPKLQTGVDHTNQVIHAFRRHQSMVINIQQRLNLVVEWSAVEM